MPVSKLDILNKRFSTKPLGYSKVEVEQFLQDVAETLGRAAEERTGLKRRIKEMDKQLAEYRQREEALRDTMITTQRMVEDLKNSARKESQLVMDEAEAKAERILQQAHNRVAEVHDDITELKRQRTQFETQLRSTLEAHLRLLDSTDPELKKVEELESKLKFLKQAT